jgi:hypothetical protein
MEQRVELDVKLHVRSGDLIGWGEASDPKEGEPPYMVVVTDNNSFSASSARSLVGGTKVKDLQSVAVDYIFTMGIFSKR